MKRIICHWTAGTHKASSEDLKHYHIVIDGDGTVHKGLYKIEDNESTADGKYAAHTRGCNTGSIGVSLACMANAVENPFSSGTYPMTKIQFDKLVELVAELSATYRIPVTPKTVLTHAEVEKNLGIKQKGKWDYTRLSFAPDLKGADACGNYLRNRVKEKIND